MIVLVFADMVTLYGWINDYSSFAYIPGIHNINCFILITFYNFCILTVYSSRFASDDWMLEHGFMDPPVADKQWYVYGVYKFVVFVHKCGYISDCMCACVRQHSQVVVVLAWWWKVLSYCPHAVVSSNKKFDSHYSSQLSCFNGDLVT